LAVKATLTLAQTKITKTKRSASKPTAGSPEIRIFVSYSHVDTATRDKLETHLAALKRDGVSTWYDGDLQAGDALDTNIARALRQSHLFIALLSPDYIASNYCWKLEYLRAMNRRARGTLRVVAVVVRPCDWKATTAAGFRLLPTDGKPVSRWRSHDQALLDVTQGVRKVVQAIRKDPAIAKPPAASRAVKSAVGRPRAPAWSTPSRETKPGGKRLSQTRTRKPR
jgi:hypothetical protein